MSSSLQDPEGAPSSPIESATTSPAAMEGRDKESRSGEEAPAEQPPGADADQPHSSRAGGEDMDGRESDEVRQHGVPVARGGGEDSDGRERGPGGNGSRARGEDAQERGPRGNGSRADGEDADGRERGPEGSGGGVRTGEPVRAARDTGTPRGSNLGWEKAEALRKSGDYATAGRAFHQMWKDRGHPSAGWRYAFCLRHAGYPGPALKVATRVASAHPDDHAAHNEYVWCLYFARLKPALASEEAHEVLQAAQEMVTAGAQDLPLELAAFAAIGAAKQKGHWQEVAEWCERLQPDRLSTEQSEGPGGRKIPSPRERYHYAKVKALVHLDKWEEARAAAEVARQGFPRNTDFQRWHAEALAGLGRLEDAVGILEPLCRDRRAKWYQLADMARFLLELGRVEEAWGQAQSALRMPAEDQARVGLLATMSRIALERKDADAAARHLAWCMALRREQGWPIPHAIAELRQRLEGVKGVEWEAPARVLRRACLGAEPGGGSGRGFVPSGGRGGATSPSGNGRGASGDAGLPTLPPAGEDGLHSGVVMSCDGDRPFAFLRVPNGERVFVLVSDLPEDCQHNGALVRFKPVRNFDRKKQKEGWRASKVQAVR